MKTRQRRALMAGIAATLLNRVQADTPIPPPASAPPPVPFMLTLHVAKPAGSDEFDFNHPDSSFDVTIRNVSPMPQMLWQDGRFERGDNGYDNVSLQVTALDGKPLAKPFGIGRQHGSWAYLGPIYPPRTQTLKPGEEALRHLLVSEVVQVYYLPSAHHKVTAVAILNTLTTFNSRPVNARYGVWSGQAVSAPVTFNALLPAFPTPTVR